MIRLGKDGKFYIGTANTDPATETTNITDVQLSDTIETADTTRRQSGGFRSRVPTLRDLSITFKMFDDTTDTVITTILAAYDARTPIAAKALRAAAGPGIVGDFFVTQCNEDESLSGAITFDVKLEMCDWYRAPARA